MATLKLDPRAAEALKIVTGAEDVSSLVLLPSNEYLFTNELGQTCCVPGHRVAEALAQLPPVPEPEKEDAR